MPVSVHAFMHITTTSPQHFEGYREMKTCVLCGMKKTECKLILRLIQNSLTTATTYVPCTVSCFISLKKTKQKTNRSV